MNILTSNFECFLKTPLNLVHPRFWSYE